MTIDNHQPTIALFQAVAFEGIFPIASDDYGSSLMAAIHTTAWKPSGLFGSNGQTASIQQNLTLFSLLQTIYGGDGNTTFGLPSLGGRLSIGQSPSTNLGTHTGLPDLPILANNLPVTYGGTGTATLNTQPNEVTQFLIRASGLVVDPGTDTSPTAAFVGAIMQFASNFAPGGYLKCDGAIKNIADYPDLYGVIGDTYGGDGITTFALPDLRGRAIVGVSVDHPLGDAFGSNSITITQTNLPTNMGGSGTPIDNHSPSLAMTYLIAVNGYTYEDGWPLDGGVLVGEVMAFAGDYAPAGYMVADGSLLDTTAYADLFSKIGYTYGGSGSQFALPDLRDVGIMNMGSGPGLGSFTLGQTMGTDDIVLTSADFPALTIAGTGADETLWGADQGDTISGGDGNDTLTGNGGNDTLDGGDDNDTADYSFATSRVKVSLALAGAQDTLGAGSDTLTGIENLTGSEFKDRLRGDAGANVLNGGDNNDHLRGGKGADTFIGGAGNDSFEFHSVKESKNAAPDTITDLTDNDRIDLLHMDADSSSGTDDPFHLIVGGFTHAAGELRLAYDSGTGKTSLQGDADGDGDADFTILITGDHTAFTNFVL